MDNTNCKQCLSFSKKFRSLRLVIEDLNGAKINNERELQFVYSKHKDLTTNNSTLKINIAVKDTEISFLKGELDKCKRHRELDLLELDLLRKNNKDLKLELESEKNKSEVNNTECKNCTLLKDSICDIRQTLKELKLLLESKEDEIMNLKNDISISKSQRKRLSEDNSKRHQELMQERDDFATKLSLVKSMCISQKEKQYQSAAKYCNTIINMVTLVLNCCKEKFGGCIRTVNVNELVTLLTHLEACIVDFNDLKDVRNEISNLIKQVDKGGILTPTKADSVSTFENKLKNQNNAEPPSFCSSSYGSNTTKEISQIVIPNEFTTDINDWQYDDLFLGNDFHDSGSLNSNAGLEFVLDKVDGLMNICKDNGSITINNRYSVGSDDDKECMKRSFHRNQGPTEVTFFNKMQHRKKKYQGIETEKNRTNIVTTDELKKKVEDYNDEIISYRDCFGSDDDNESVISTRKLRKRMFRRNTKCKEDLSLKRRQPMKKKIKGIKTNKCRTNFISRDTRSGIQELGNTKMLDSLENNIQLVLEYSDDCKTYNKVQIDDLNEPPLIEIIKLNVIDIDAEKTGFEMERMEKTSEQPEDNVSLFIENAGETGFKMDESMMMEGRNEEAEDNISPPMEMIESNGTDIVVGEPGFTMDKSIVIEGTNAEDNISPPMEIIESCGTDIDPEQTGFLMDESLIIEETSDEAGDNVSPFTEMIESNGTDIVVGEQGFTKDESIVMEGRNEEVGDNIVPFMELMLSNIVDIDAGETGFKIDEPAMMERTIEESWDNIAYASDADTQLESVLFEKQVDNNEREQPIPTTVLDTSLESVCVIILSDSSSEDEDYMRQNYGSQRYPSNKNLSFSKHDETILIDSNCCPIDLSVPKLTNIKKECVDEYVQPSYSNIIEPRSNPINKVALKSKEERKNQTEKDGLGISQKMAKNLDGVLMLPNENQMEIGNVEKSKVVILTNKDEGNCESEQNAKASLPRMRKNQGISDSLKDHQMQENKDREGHTYKGDMAIHYKNNDLTQSKSVTIDLIENIVPLKKNHEDQLYTEHENGEENVENLPNNGESNSFELTEMNETESDMHVEDIKEASSKVGNNLRKKTKDVKKDLKGLKEDYPVLGRMCRKRRMKNNEPNIKIRDEKSVADSIKEIIGEMGLEKDSVEIREVFGRKINESKKIISTNEKNSESNDKMGIDESISIGVTEMRKESEFDKTNVEIRKAQCKNISKSSKEVSKNVKEVLEISPNLEQEKIEEIKKRTEEAREIRRRKTICDSKDVTKSVTSNNHNQAVNISKIVSAKKAKTTKKPLKNKIDNVKNNAMLCDMRPINNKALVIMERTTKQQLKTLKVCNTNTDYVSGNKRARIDSAMVDKTRDTKIKRDNAKSKVQTKKEKEPSKLMDVTVAQMLSRKLNGDDVERFQRVSSFVGRNKLLTKILCRANDYAARVRQIFADYVRTASPDIQRVITAEVAAMKRWDMAKLVDAIMDFVSSDSGTALPRRYVVQVAASMMVNIIVGQKEQYRYYYEVLLNKVHSADGRPLINLISINITVLIWLQQPDLIVSFIVDLISVPMVPMLMIARCLPPSIVINKMDAKYATFIKLMKSLVVYEYSTTSNANHRLLFSDLPSQTQEFWLDGRNCGNFDRCQDFDLVLGLVKKTQQEYEKAKTKANWKFLDRIITSKYK